MRHEVVYITRPSSVVTDARLTDQMQEELSHRDRRGWVLVGVVGRVGALGDITGVWLFFRHDEESLEAA
jgi:hypothetical protein